MLNNKLDKTITETLNQLKHRLGADVPKSFDYLYQPTLNDQMDMFVTQQKRIDERLRSIISTIVKIKDNYSDYPQTEIRWHTLVAESYFGLFKASSNLQKLLANSTKQIQEVPDRFLPQKAQLLATQDSFNKALTSALSLVEDCYKAIGQQCLTNKHWAVCAKIPSDLAQIAHEHDYLGNLCACYYVPTTMYGDKNQPLDLFVTIVETISSSCDSRSIEIAILNEMKSPSRIAGIPINNPDDIDMCLIDLMKKDNLSTRPEVLPVDITELPSGTKYEGGVLKIPVDANDTMDIKTWGQRTEQLIDLIPNERLAEYHAKAAKAFNLPIEKIRSRAIAEGSQLWLLYSLNY
jgi:hypothetical protein